MKKAFTMFEAIIAIVLFGIIAGIGAEIVKTMYMNYIHSRTVNYLQTQSGIALEQIAKRLQYRIKDTVIARNTDNGNIRVLNHPDVDENYDVIEWIGYSNEAMLGNTPGWSGFVDIDNLETNKLDNTIKTPGSNLESASQIMNVLSGETVNMAGAKYAALIFKQKPAGYYDPEDDDGYGWRQAGNINANFLIRVTRRDATTFLTDGNNPNSIFEQYYLAHTAYAIVKENPVDEYDFSLVLKYNYQPWLGTNYQSEATKSAVLAENVNLFRVQQIGSTIRIKLCLHDGKKSGTGDYIVACKEEVIL